MTLLIRRTGLEEYAPGGRARLKLLNIGGPASGKTRFASFWPDPIWADCEGGLASVADRNVPYGTINTSDDMLDFLKDMKLESSKPDASRQFQTVVIDTLDAFQRKVKDEWLQKNPNSQSFRGFDAWGYLDSKMQMLLTRLLNLDMNVIVNVHYKERVIREGTGDNASERQEYMLQLSGDVKDSAFNDFDLVGWMGTYWAPATAEQGGGRIEKRGLTFTRTPERPFLKDRLFFTPPWFEINFADSDYTGLFTLLQKRIEEIRTVAGEGGEVVREITSAADFRPEPGAGVVTPSQAMGGALDPQAERELPLEKRDKPDLQNIARTLGFPFKGNTLKSELLVGIHSKGGLEAYIKAVADQKESAAIAAEALSQPGEVVVSGLVDVAPATDEDISTSIDAVVVPEAPAASPEPEPVVEVPTVDFVPPVADPTCDALGLNDKGDAAKCGYDKGHVGERHSWTPRPAPTPVQSASTVVTEDGPVDTATGELVDEVKVADVAAALGGEVIEVTGTPTPPPAEPAPAAPEPAPSSENCGYVGCDTLLADGSQNQDYVKLSFIKFQRRLCNTHFIECKKSGKSEAQLRAANTIA